MDLRLRHDCYSNITEKFPGTTIDVISVSNLDTRTVQALLRINTTHLSEILKSFRQHHMIKSVRNRGNIVHITAVAEETLYKTISDAGCIPLPNFVMAEGVEYWSLFSFRQKDLQKAYTNLKKIASVNLLSVNPSEIYHSDILTPKQREAIEAAKLYGYYDIPKKVTLDELAKKIGINHSAFAERLARAEQKVISKYTRKYPGKS